MRALDKGSGAWLRVCGLRGFEGLGKGFQCSGSRLRCPDLLLTLTATSDEDAFQNMGLFPSSRKPTVPADPADSARPLLAPSASSWRSALPSRPAKARGDWQPAQCDGDSSAAGL